MNYNKSLTATVYIVNTKTRKILLHIHKKYATWFPPGGHFCPDELPHEAAIREVREETGLIIGNEASPLISCSVYEKFDTGLVEDIPSPFRIYREGIGSDEEFLDFNYIALTECEDISPDRDGESNTFAWFSRKELEDSNDVKLHIKNTAMAVIEYLESIKII